MLEHILDARGPQLRSFNLSTNILVKFDVVFQSIMVSGRLHSTQKIEIVFDLLLAGKVCQLGGLRPLKCGLLERPHVDRDRAAAGRLSTPQDSVSCQLALQRKARFFRG